MDEDIEGTPYKAMYVYTYVYTSYEYAYDVFRVEATNDSDYTVDKPPVKKAKRRKKEVKLNKQNTTLSPPADHKVQSDKDKVLCVTTY